MSFKKKRLVFYSGGQNLSNAFLHNQLVSLGRQPARSMTYIPFSHENGEAYFQRIKKRYSQYGIKKFRYFPVDADFIKKEMKEALKSDIIYLAGGNTFYFLKHLRQSGFLKELEKFIKKGGVVAGLSAGAIVLTPHIFMAAYPKHECDRNEVRLKNLKALGAVNFEFYPHYSYSTKTHRALLAYSKKVKHAIYACSDGSGLVVKDNEFRLVGRVYIYFQGRRLRV